MIESFKKIFRKSPEATPDGEDVLRRLERPSAATPESVVLLKPTSTEQEAANPAWDTLHQELEALENEREVMIAMGREGSVGNAPDRGLLDALDERIARKKADIALIRK